MVDRNRAIAVTLVAALVSGLAGFYVGHRGLIPLPGGKDGLPAGEWAKLRQVRDYIKEKYVEPVSDQQLVEGAVRGLVEATGDEYSVYFNRQTFKDFLAGLDDHFGGIGVKVEFKDHHVTIVSPIQGTPAARAGLRPGDRIVAVDGQDVTQLPLPDVVSRIRGPAGTPVRLTIERDGKRFDVSIVRAEIPLLQIEWRMLDPQAKIGYVQILQFNEGIGARTRQAVAALKAEGMRGLILDLRQNPGGFLHEAVEVASVFLPPGPVVHVVDRSGKRITHRSEGPGLDLPLVVLVDQGSASAAEVVAGAIKDRGAGVLVGQRTFGKASVQTSLPLPDGSGLKLTTARYLTAGGRPIDGKGIEPDVWVEVSPDPDLPLDDPRHPQLQKAVEILRQRIR